MKPLFIPLKAEHYLAFSSGNKDTEYRLYGKRWNKKTCAPGRDVILSYGYGKQRRSTGVIHDVIVCLKSNLSIKMQNSVETIYNLSRIDNPPIIMIEIWDIKEITLRNDPEHSKGKLGD